MEGMAAVGLAEILELGVSAVPDVLVIGEVAWLGPHDAIRVPGNSGGIQEEFRRNSGGIYPSASKSWHSAAGSSPW